MSARVPTMPESFTRAVQDTIDAIERAVSPCIATDMYWLGRGRLVELITQGLITSDTLSVGVRTLTTAKDGRIATLRAMAQAAVRTAA